MFEWNLQQIAELERLWAEGLSSTEIGKKMGGLSRNAILGKAHRLGLAGRKNPDASRKPRKSRMKTGIERKVIAAGLARYCGGTKTDDSSYCAEHYKKNYVPARIR